jgi:hypothetical protein
MSNGYNNTFQVQISSQIRTGGMRQRLYGDTFEDFHIHKFIKKQECTLGLYMQYPNEYGFTSHHKDFGGVPPVLTMQ